MKNTQFNPQGIWCGHFFGTNIGVLSVRFYNSKNQLKAKAFFVDQQFGPTTVLASGNLSDNKGTFKLSEFHSLAPFIPISGQLSLVFNPDNLTAEGTWLTDLMTSGTCRLTQTKMSLAGLWLKIIEIRLKWLVRRCTSLIYLLFLFLIALGSLCERVKLSTLNLILLLLPAPFLFTKQLGKLIDTLRHAKLKKFGPFEIDQTPPSPEIVAAASTTNSSSPAAFDALNKFFVPRTKFMLSAISQRGSVTNVEFVQLAKDISIPFDNIEQTLTALLEVSCVEVESNLIKVTNHGRNYLKFMKFGNG